MFRLAKRAPPALAIWFSLAAMAAPLAAGAPHQASIFMDDDLLLYRGPARTEAMLRELAGLGVDMVRISVHWRAVAPSHRSTKRPLSLAEQANPRRYPAENWDTYDTLVRAARRQGIEVLMNVTGGAPLWATGTLGGKHVSLQYIPDAKAFEAFMTAIGRRYSGRFLDENQGRHELPLVRDWSIWNEPNHGALLQPQWREDPRDAAAPKLPYSPHLYRRLFRAAQTALFRSGHSADVVLLGETAPRGNSQPGLRRHIRPMRFLRELFCLGDDLRPLQGSEAEVRGCDFDERGPLFATGYAHHPYSIVWTPATKGFDPDDALLGDTDRLVEMLDLAGDAARIPTRLPLWYTEYGYQTMPPDPIRGVTPEQQSEWLAEAERLAWSSPRVYAMNQFLMLDSLPRDAAPAGSRRYWGTFQSGLRYADGKPKPAYFSYRLPFIVRPAGPEVELWGMVRPGDNGYSQTIRLEFRPAGASSFTAMSEPLSVDDERGYFTLRRPSAGDGEWRFSWLNPDGGAWIPSPARRPSTFG